MISGTWGLCANCLLPACKSWLFSLRNPMSRIFVKKKGSLLKIKVYELAIRENALETKVMNTIGPLNIYQNTTGNTITLVFVDEETGVLSKVHVERLRTGELRGRLGSVISELLPWVCCSLIVAVLHCFHPCMAWGLRFIRSSMWFELGMFPMARALRARSWWHWYTHCGVPKSGAWQVKIPH